MLKAKKQLVLLLSAAMVISTFAGCGKKAANANTGTTQDNGPKPTLKALVLYKSGLDYNNYPVQKFLEDKTGYKVEYDVLPQDNPMDKLNVIMASGQDYDFITINDSTRYSTYSQQGALLDLEPLVKKYGPNITKNIDKAMFDRIRVNGKYYAIPTSTASGRKDSTNILSGILVRQDWMDKLGIKAPTTIDEFTDMLKQFKDKDPNGNGAKNIPLTSDNTMNLLTTGIAGAFGLEFNWNDVNGKLVNQVQMPGFKDYILYLKDLYNKGLIDKESPTNQFSTAKEKFTSGRAGAFADGWGDIPTIDDTLKKTQPNAKVVYLPPVSGKYGKAVEVAGDLKSSIDYFTFIPKSSKHAEDVIKYFNLKLEEDTFRTMVIGDENVDYTVKDGGYYPILPNFFNDRGNANQYLTGASSNYGQYWLARVRKDDRLYEGWKELNIDFAQHVEIDPMSTAPTLDAVAKHNQILQKLESDFITKSVVGDFSDSTLNAFIAQWKAQGGDEETKEINDWYSKAKK